MSKWIKKTPLAPLNDIPLRVSARTEESTDHVCSPPSHVDAGPRSVWECDCGRRWRIATPYWRPMAAHEVQAEPASLPSWVLTLGPETTDPR